MKTCSILILTIMLSNCTPGSPNKEESQMVETIEEQRQLFDNLITVANHSIPEIETSDSLSILLLPVQASCPSCRKKTIDSILSNTQNLKPNQYIIISANGGLKMIRSYFKEENADLPDIPGKIIIDSTNKANSFKLYRSNPAIYYTANRMVYKRTLVRPSSVRKDLHEFFAKNTQ